jgi:hypothetical protein
MTVHFFRNRWYRLYFQLLDSFGQSRCCLCFLLSQIEHGLISTLLRAADQRRKSRVSLKMLCVLHKSQLKKAAADDAPLLPMLKTVIRDFRRQLAHPPKQPPPKWSHWLRQSRAGCPWCGQLLSEERTLCRSVIQFLDDTEFWKEFQRAPLLCLDHLEKCLSFGSNGKGFGRLLNDQSAKLNELLNDLVRFEVTGTNEVCKVTALDWLADFGAAPSVSNGRVVVSSGEDNIPTDLFSKGHTDGSTGDGCDQEDLLFERERLSRKVWVLTQRLNELETRAASLQYRVATLSEDNKRLEMGYTGASTQARGLEKLVRDLTVEIKILKEGNSGERAKPAS